MTDWARKQSTDKTGDISRGQFRDEISTQQGQSTPLVWTSGASTAAAGMPLPRACVPQASFPDGFLWTLL